MSRQRRQVSKVQANNVAVKRGARLSDSSPLPISYRTPLGKSPFAFRRPCGTSNSIFCIPVAHPVYDALVFLSALILLLEVTVVPRISLASHLRLESSGKASPAYPCLSSSLSRHHHSSGLPQIRITLGQGPLPRLFESHPHLITHGAHQTRRYSR